MCFLFFQANLILVPFPTHRQQVIIVCQRPVKWVQNPKEALSAICKNTRLHMVPRRYTFVIWMPPFGFFFVTYTQGAECEVHFEKCQFIHAK